jgi:hypothetical protein
VGQRHRAAAQHGSEGEDALRVEDGRDGQDLVQQHVLVVRQVLRRHLDHEVVRTRDHVAGHHGRDRHQRALDLVRRRPGMPVDLQPDEGGQAEAGLGPADLGPVALDDSAGLQRLDPAQAGRGGQRDGLSQVDVGDAAVALQGAENGPVGTVSRYWHENHHIAQSTAQHCVIDGNLRNLCHRMPPVFADD